MVHAKYKKDIYEMLEKLGTHESIKIRLDVKGSNYSDVEIYLNKYESLCLGIYFDETGIFKSVDAFMIGQGSIGDYQR